MSEIRGRIANADWSLAAIDAALSARQRIDDQASALTIRWRRPHNRSRAGDLVADWIAAARADQGVWKAVQTAPQWLGMLDRVPINILVRSVDGEPRGVQLWLSDVPATTVTLSLDDLSALGDAAI